MTKETKESTINFFLSSDEDDWVMRITPGKIHFNRERFPSLTEDEFAEGVLKILEHTNWIMPREENNGRREIA